jgi:hypothetical protein|nr:MAG TPA: hypothetical protein [Caudoviricetes sp.]
MNPKFAQMVKSHTPRIDDRIGFGLAYHDNGRIPLYIDNLFRVNSTSFPDGLQYLGFRAATPIEGYKYMTRNNGDRSPRRHDINRSDLRLYKFLFKFDGKELAHYIYLPFIRKHGFMYLNGVKYMVSPVMADGIITVKPDRVFLKLIKIKLWFRRLTNIKVVVDGQIHCFPIIYSKIHNKKIESPMIKMATTMVHYLCCEYGMDGMLARFGFKPGDVKMTHADDLTAIRDTQYPQEQYVILESTGNKPTYTYRYRDYYPNRWCYVIKREAWETLPSAKSVLATLVYIQDHFSSEKRMSPELANSPEAWKSILGDLISNPGELAAASRSMVEKHMISIRGYIDDMVMSDFKRIGLDHIKSINDAFVFIIDNFNDMVASVSNDTSINTLYGKQLQVLQFLLFNITKAINYAYFGLGNLKLKQKENPATPIKEREIADVLRTIRTETFMDIREHREIMILSDPTDLPLLKPGRIMVPQERSDKQRTRSGPAAVNDVVNKLSDSLLTTGAAKDMTKTDPSGQSRMNLYIYMDDEYTVSENPELKPIMDHVRELLYR